MNKEFNEKVIENYAVKMFEDYKNSSKNWRRRHKERSSFEKCLIISWNYAKSGYLPEAVLKKDNKKNNKSFKFESYNLKKRYQTYSNYLSTRCRSLPSQLERRFKNCYARHKESTCYGMSNYIEIHNEDDLITVRLSDHEPTGSGSSCDFYIYIQDKTWMEIKKEVFEIAEDFCK